MTDDELNAIWERSLLSYDDYLAGLPPGQAREDIAALVAEVRRLRAQSDPEGWPVGYCAVCGAIHENTP